jgi:hypothetical protein
MKRVPFFVVNHMVQDSLVGNPGNVGLGSFEIAVKRLHQHLESSFGLAPAGFPQE